MISREVKQLQDIENALSKEFFKDVKKRFRRKTRRSTMDPTYRRKSFNTKSVRPTSQIFLDPFEGTPSKSDGIRSTSVSTAMYKRPTRQEIDSLQVDTLDLIDGPLMTSDSVPIGSDNLDKSTYTEHQFSPKSPGQVKFAGVSPIDDVYSEVSPSPKITQSLGAAALDFEFNMIVDIKSGKCTFHSQVCNDVPKYDPFFQSVFVINLCMEGHSLSEEVFWITSERMNEHLAYVQIRYNSPNCYFSCEIHVHVYRLYRILYVIEDYCQNCVKT